MGTAAALYYIVVELENLMRTNTQTDRELTENSITEATLIPVDRRGERANISTVQYSKSLCSTDYTTRYWR